MAGFNDAYPEILDRIEDMRLKHAVEIGGLDMTTFYGDTLNCQKFVNQENGDRLVIADPPIHLAKMIGAQAAIRLHAGEGELILPTSHTVLTAQELNFVVDHEGTPFVRLEEPGIWESLSPGYLVWMLDKSMYEMTADFDPRNIPPFGVGSDIELVVTPTMASYTLAAGALDRNMLGGVDDEVAYLAGAVQHEGDIDQPPNTYTMQVSEKEHEADETGFRRLFEVSAQLADPVRMLIKKIGSNEIVDHLTEDLDFVISRDGLVVWYKSIDDQGNSRWRIGDPVAGDTDVSKLLRNSVD